MYVCIEFRLSFVGYIITLYIIGQLTPTDEGENYNVFGGDADKNDDHFL